MLNLPSLWKHLNQVGLFCVVAALSAASASAAPTEATGLTRTRSEGWRFDVPADPAWPWRIFVGMGAGRGAVSGGEFSDSLTGSQILAELLLSYEHPHWAADVGAGWFYSRGAGADSAGRSLDIRTRMGVLDFSPRYRFWENSPWQIGPLVRLGYGADTAFGPSVQSNASINAFAGGRLVYTISPGRFSMRAFGEGLTDLTISGRTVAVALVGLQIGAPLNASEKMVTDTVSLTRAAPKAAEPDLEFEQDALAESPAPPEVRVVLDTRKIFFGTNSAELRPVVMGALKKVGKSLQESGEDWGSLDISGHADRRGRFQMNLDLSRKRAESVREGLLGGGADERKFQTEGFSYLRPADPGNDAKALARNRRVELVFREVRNAEAFRKLISPLLEFEEARNPVLRPKRAGHRGSK